MSTIQDPSSEPIRMSRRLITAATGRGARRSLARYRYAFLLEECFKLHYKSPMKDSEKPVGARLRRLVRVLAGSAQVQIRLTRHNIEDFRPLFGMPLVALVAIAVLVHSGRADLAPRGLVAASLMTIGQMALFVASEIVFMERNGQTLELVVASPAPYVAVLSARVVVLAALGMFGVAESWLIARYVFQLELTVYHPLLLVWTLLASALAAGGTAVLTAALFSLGKQVRTFQNAINGPLYLLGGVLVPATFLPVWLQPLSKFVFFYWSAGLLRACFAPEPPQGAARALLLVLTLGVVTWLVGGVVLRRMLDHLRRDGTLGLT
jgi:ABC-2 type transport system permease protein